MGLLAILAQCRDENARRIELVTAELCHQTAAGPLEEPPAAEFFKSSSRAAVAQLEIRIAVLVGIDLLILHPGFPLGHLLVEQAASNGIFLAVSPVLQFFQLVGDEVDLSLLALDVRLDGERQRLL